MLFGRVSRKILLTHPKTNSSKFSYQTRLELQTGLSSMVRCKLKKYFLAANPPDEFSTNRDKKYPMPTVKYTAVFLMLWAYICWRSWTSCSDAWRHGFYQIQQIKNQHLTASVTNLIMGRVSIFHTYNNPNKTSNQHKNVSLSTK